MLVKQRDLPSESEHVISMAFQSVNLPSFVIQNFVWGSRNW